MTVPQQRVSASARACGHREVLAGIGVFADFEVGVDAQDRYLSGASDVLRIWCGYPAGRDEDHVARRDGQHFTGHAQRTVASSTMKASSSA